MLPADVLIVGAGPTGLACAASLVGCGAKNIVIVDAQEPSQGISRAVVIHAQTLEDLDSIGCSEPFTSRGIVAESISIFSKSKPLMSGDFSRLSPRTRFPYALLITQSETEVILEEHLQELGVSVLRPVTVCGMERTNDGVIVAFLSGDVIKARYVIGADGARSTVRMLAGITFKDPKTGRDTYSEDNKDEKKTAKPQNHFVIADVHLKGELPPIVKPTDISVFLGKPGFLLFVQLPPDPTDPRARPIYRLSCPAELGATDITVSYLQNVLTDAFAYPAERTPVVDTLLWSSRYQARRGMADTMVRRLGPGPGVVLLVGDAAHVHPPVGVQGMNLGIRDAIALGRTLAGILNSPTEPSKSPVMGADFAERKLETFSKERQELALKMNKTTELLTWATELRGAPARTIRNFIIGSLGLTPFGNKVALRLSGLQTKTRKER